MSLDFLDHTKGKLVNVRADIRAFLDDRMEDYYNRIVIPEIKAVARAANTPEAFVESFAFVKTGPNRGKIINTLGTKSEPLAKWFNYGTKRNYEIRPKVEHPPGAQRSQRDAEKVGDTSVVHPTVLHWIDPITGEHKYAKYTIHPGQPQTLAMEIGLQEGLKRLIPEVQKDVKQKFGNRNE